MESILVKSWQDAARVVVNVGSYDAASKQPVCCGSGVIVLPNLVLTAAHVIAHLEHLGRRPYALAFEQEPPSGGAIRWNLVYREGEPTKWNDRDLGVLSFREPIASTPRITVPLAIAVISPVVPSVGEPVDSYGVPPTIFETIEGARVGVAFSGMVHTHRHVRSATPQLIHVTHPNPHGLSGGPLFDRTGALIGIASETCCQPDAMLSKGHAMTGSAIYAGIADIVADMIESAKRG